MPVNGSVKLVVPPALMRTTGSAKETCRVGAAVVGAAVGRALGALVGAAVGAVVVGRALVDAAEGVAVGVSVGRAVGAAVGAAVGPAVDGMAVGVSVKSAEGVAVGPTVGAALGALSAGVSSTALICPLLEMVRMEMSRLPAFTGTRMSSKTAGVRRVAQPLAAGARCGSSPMFDPPARRHMS